RPDQIKLLLDGDAPERYRDGSGHAVNRKGPVSEEYSEWPGVFPAELVPREYERHDEDKGQQECVVQGPDAKRTADIECADINFSAQTPFAHQKVGNEIPAEREEHVNAESAGDLCCDDPLCDVDRHASADVRSEISWHCVVDEHCEEGKESKHIELGPIEAAVHAPGFSAGTAEAMHWRCPITPEQKV